MIKLVCSVYSKSLSVFLKLLLVMSSAITHKLHCFELQTRRYPHELAEPRLFSLSNLIHLFHFLSGPRRSGNSVSHIQFSLIFLFKMIIHHISRITLQLRRVRPLHWTVLKRLPQPKYHPTKSVALTVCCAFIGVASYKRLPQILFSRAACQEAVLEHPVPINSEIDRLHSVKSLLVGQMRLWHHVLRTLASNLVQFVLVSLRYIRNSILFGPLLVSYPLVLLFPDRLQDVWLRALLRSIELSGPTFIKLGQWASTRRDLFAQDFCDQLSRLHRNAPSHSVEYTKRALEHAFGLLWKEIFRLESSNETVYSGCVGQVHKVYMRPDVYQGKNL